MTLGVFLSIDGCIRLTIRFRRLSTAAILAIHLPFLLLCLCWDTEPMGLSRIRELHLRMSA